MPVLVLAACLALLSSCAARRAPAPEWSYRIARAGAQDFLLSPGSPADDRPSHTPVLPARKSGKDCRAEGEPLRVRKENTGWTLAMPGLSWWVERSPSDIAAGLPAFLESTEGLRARRCVSDEEMRLLQSAIVESLPAPLTESLQYVYGYPSNLGIVDLRPHMRLHIQRAWILEGQSPGLESYRGTSPVAYHTKAAGAGGMRIERETLPQPPAGFSWQEREWPRSLRAQRHYRLFLLSHLVREKRRRTAMVVGAPSFSGLARATAAVEKNPEVSCAQLGRVECLSFDGSVSVAAQFEVSVNGQSQHLGLGATVRAVLPKSGAPTVKVWRRFAGLYVPVQGEDLARLPLSAGDRISW